MMRTFRSGLLAPLFVLGLSGCISSPNAPDLAFDGGDFDVTIPSEDAGSASLTFPATVNFGSSLCGGSAT